jgi:hypothetical protein
VDGRRHCSLRTRDADALLGECWFHGEVCSSSWRVVGGGSRHRSSRREAPAPPARASLFFGRVASGLADLTVKELSGDQPEWRRPMTSPSGCATLAAMTTLEEIEKAVAALPPDQLIRFRAWFEEFQAASFDQRIERDAKAGRLDQLAEQALADFKAGRAREL